MSFPEAKMSADTTQVDPQAAYELMTADPPTIYVDVRLPEDFNKSHAAGAVNVPVMLNYVDFEINPNFVAEVEAAVGGNTVPIVMGCKGGKASPVAVGILQEAGWPGSITNMLGGFAGYTAAELPTE